ncbi:MAG TPA: TonB-dependent receptor [Nevskiaceae bacterium]|nr:TonB-dependent receptor [Nevskiaceae bacterium]
MLLILRRCMLLLSSAIAPVWVGVAHAQETQDVATIPVETPEAAPAEPPAEAEDPAGGIQEIVVSANKRTESISTIAGAVTAIDSATLEQAGASQLGEYLSLSPGVNFSSSTPGYSVITIRGVSSDTINNLAQTAVGVYYDDIPLTDPAAPMVVPDIDAFDAQRVEVLRGPQGALYGSASLGGAVNYIPQPPDAGDVAFAVHTTGSQSTNSKLGGTGKAMVNVPLVEDVLALRVVGHYTRVPGTIDNVGTGEDGSNDITTRGGRATLGWHPTDLTTVRLTGLFQDTGVADAAYMDPRLGDLKKDTLVPEPSHNEIRLMNLRVEQEIGDAGTLAFIGGYQDKSSALEYDGASALGLGGLGQQILLQQAGQVEGYSAELRFVSPSGETFEYLAGVSYATRDEDFDVTLNLQTLEQTNEQLAAFLALLGLELPPVAGDSLTLADQGARITAPEKAAFFEGTLRFLDGFKLTAGGRYYDNEVDSTIVGSGLLVASTGGLSYSEDRKETGKGFNPKVSLAWEGDDALVYGLFSRGYRLGGPNVVPSTPIFRTQPTYEADQVRNYEIGAKTAWLDRRVTADLALFWIDWKDIQLVVTESTGVYKYLDNAGNARIKGAELSLAVQPVSFLTLRSSLTYLDARLREDYDPNNNRPPAEKGDRLPGSPKWAASNTLSTSWADLSWQPSVTLIHRYEGESSTNLSFQDVKKGDYHTLDLRAGVKVGPFSLTAFGRNLTDERGITAANNYQQPGGDIVTLHFINPPRCVGLELGYSFSP